MLRFLVLRTGGVSVFFATDLCGLCAVKWCLRVCGSGLCGSMIGFWCKIMCGAFFDQLRGFLLFFWYFGWFFLLRFSMLLFLLVVFVFCRDLF
jgi:hypothetical protein